MRRPISMIVLGSIVLQVLTVHVSALLSYTLVGQDTPSRTASYILATEALAADDFDKARMAFIALARQSQGDLRRKADVAVSAVNIRTMRTAFREISEEIIPLGVPAGYEVIICRMFRNARWIQKSGTIANPYF